MNMTNLVPINGCILIKLGQTHKNFNTTETKYQTRTEGTVAAIWDNENDREYQYLVGKKVYFEEYKEGARIKRDDGMYCFINYSDLRGYED